MGHFTPLLTTLNDIVLVFWCHPQGHDLAPSSSFPLTICHLCFAHLITALLVLCQVLEHTEFFYIPGHLHMLFLLSQTLFPLFSIPFWSQLQTAFLVYLTWEKALTCHYFLTWPSSYFLKALDTLPSCGIYLFLCLLLLLFSLSTKWKCYWASEHFCLSIAAELRAVLRTWEILHRYFWVSVKSIWSWTEQYFLPLLDRWFECQPQNCYKHSKVFEPVDMTYRNDYIWLQLTLLLIPQVLFLL